MPIIITSKLNHTIEQRLAQAGAVTISQKKAQSQDIRPARIGILNLMPAEAMQATEVQWLRYMSNTLLQIEPVFIKFDDDWRESKGSSRSQILADYLSFSEVKESGLDGLIVTGDNLELTANKSELLPLDQIRYAKQLEEVLQWAKSNVYSTIYSCLASHFALHYFHGLQRRPIKTKTFGVFTHAVDTHSLFTQGVDDTMRAPHSRWGSIGAGELTGSGVQILAQNTEVGWLLAQEKNQAKGYDLYIQGHPEYDRNDLKKEFQRDHNTLPANYFRDNDPSQEPALSWTNDARALHSNWITMLYTQFS